MNLPPIDTYIYIDASNIRGACLRSCNFVINFPKLYSYFATKHPNLRAVRYYEGIAANDTKKQAYFNRLQACGYIICTLKRKSYTEPAKHLTFICTNCQHPNSVQAIPQHIKLKSNVDVYLATDMLKQAAVARNPLHIILVSCDGDYAEAIRSIFEIRPDTKITVLATPTTKRNNCLSARIKDLARDYDQTRFKIQYIADIKDRISQP